MDGTKECCTCPENGVQHCIVDFLPTSREEAINMVVEGDVITYCTADTNTAPCPASGLDRIFVCYHPRSPCVERTSVWSLPGDVSREGRVAVAASSILTVWLYLMTWRKMYVRSMLATLVETKLKVRPLPFRRLLSWSHTDYLVTWRPSDRCT